MLRVRSQAGVGRSVSMIAVLGIFCVLLVPRSSADAAVPAGAPGLPAAIEQPTPYVPAISCDPTPKSGAVKLGALLKASYKGSTYGVARTCGTAPNSEHLEGRAIDWMINSRVKAQNTHANAMIKWFLAKDKAGNAFATARRLGVMYLIWDDKIWSAHRADEGWRPYSNCAKDQAKGSDSRCHRNHIHVSLSWAGAMGLTSYWTKQVAAVDYGPCRPADLNWAPTRTTVNPSPCPSYAKVSAPSGSAANLKALYASSGMSLKQGSSGGGVKAVQTALKITSDGRFGPQTAGAVRAFQRTRGLAQTGVMDQRTWRTLLAVERAKQPKPVNPLTQYKNTVLKLDSRGAAVKALQKALKITSDGWFGPQTEKSVKAFQKAKKLPVTGVVESKTWAALGA